MTAFAMVSGAHEILHVLFKSTVSASPSPVELLLSSSAGLQSQMLWELLFLMSGLERFRTHSCGRTSVIYSFSRLWVARW